MSRQEINQKIIGYLSRYNPEKIGIFGSFARGEETASSDVDILISIKNSLGLLQLVKMERELSELLGRKVDLLTERSLKNEKLKKYIYQDLKIIFE